MKALRILLLVLAASMVANVSRADGYMFTTYYPYSSSNILFPPPAQFPTFVASFPYGYTIPSGTGDIVVLQGVAGKVIRITEIDEANLNFACNCVDGYQWFRRSSANTGGTLVSMDLGRMDVSLGSPSMTPKYYTTGPATTGTLAGIMSTQQFLDNSGEVVMSAPSINSPWILSGASDFIVYNMNGGDQPARFQSIYWYEGSR